MIVKHDWLVVNISWLVFVLYGIDGTFEVPEYSRSQLLNTTLWSRCDRWRPNTQTNLKLSLDSRPYILLGGSENGAPTVEKLDCCTFLLRKELHLRSSRQPVNQNTFKGFGFGFGS